MLSLSKGSRGPEVRRLQTALGITADGVFGSATEAALITYQARHHLKPDGIAGPVTLSALGLDNTAAAPVRPVRDIDAIIVHCTAGPQTQSARQVAEYHTRPKAAGGMGWSVPGYHYIVEPDGNVVQLLPEHTPSNGVKGHNSHIINVSYIGGIDSRGRGIDNRTPAQKSALLSLLRTLRRRYPAAHIMGHRDIASVDTNHNGIIDPWERVKECPCFNAIDEYRGI